MPELPTSEGHAAEAETFAGEPEASLGVSSSSCGTHAGRKEG